MSLRGERVGVEGDLRQVERASCDFRIKICLDFLEQLGNMYKT